MAPQVNYNRPYWEFTDYKSRQTWYMQSARKGRQWVGKLTDTRWKLIIWWADYEVTI